MRPALFENGEKVRLVSKVSPESNGEYHIIDMGYGRLMELQRNGDFVSGWWYELNPVPAYPNKWFESSLRKLPPEATDKEFERFMDRLNLPNLIPETV